MQLGFGCTMTHYLALCVLPLHAGLVIAYYADNQLRDFMLSNEERKALGLEPRPVLDTGTLSGALCFHHQHTKPLGFSPLFAAQSNCNAVLAAQSN